MVDASKCQGDTVIVVLQAIQLLTTLEGAIREFWGFRGFFVCRHELWTTRGSFYQKYQTFGLGQTNWAKNLGGIWGIFHQTVITHFGTVSPMSMFSITQPAFESTSQILFGIGI